MNPLVFPATPNEDGQDFKVLVLPSMSPDVGMNQLMLQRARSMEQFHIIAELGDGSFGSVFKARYSITGKEV
jgi:serine/threonine protein kinase